MEQITPEEARQRFGELEHSPTRTYREFDADGGIWRPVYSGHELIGYRLYKIQKVSKTHPSSRWRRR